MFVFLCVLFCCCLFVQWLAGRDYLPPTSERSESTMALDRNNDNDNNDDDNDNNNNNIGASISAMASPTLSGVATISQVLRKLKR